MSFQLNPIPRGVEIIPADQIVTTDFFYLIAVDLPVIAGGYERPTLVSAEPGSGLIEFDWGEDSFDYTNASFATRILHPGPLSGSLFSPEGKVKIKVKDKKSAVEGTFAKSHSIRDFNADTELNKISCETYKNLSKPKTDDDEGEYILTAMVNVNFRRAQYMSIKLVPVDENTSQFIAYPDVITDSSDVNPAFGLCKFTRVKDMSYSIMIDNLPDTKVDVRFGEKTI